jgi:hypothetical protein
MAAAGMRGVRLNFETTGESNPDNARRRLLETAEQLSGRNVASGALMIALPARHRRQ